MLGNPRLLGTGLFLMIAGAASDMDKSWVVVAAGLALVTMAVLQTVELELLSRVATAQPPNAPQLVSQTGPPEPFGRRERITHERHVRERHW